MLLSPYKCSRIFAPGFMKSLTDRSRGFAEYYVQRPWAHGYMVYMTDARFPPAIACFLYFCNRFTQSRVEEDEFDRVIIERWGGNVDAVRQHLANPDDYARARAYAQYEHYQGSFMAPELKYLPA